MEHALYLRNWTSVNCPLSTTFLINHVLYKAFLLKSPSIKALLTVKFEPTNHAEFQRIARRDKKAFLSNQWKEIEKKIIEWERLVISSIWHEMAFKRWEEYTEELYKKKIFMTQIITIE